MSFYELYLKYKNFNPDYPATPDDGREIARILRRQTLKISDFFTLLSPAAEPYLERMAQKAHQLTVHQFGRTILLYTPLYLSNFCTNECLYCGFNSKNKIERKQLTLEEVEKEAKAIAETGLKHILILTGDARNMADLPYLKNCIKILADYFSSIAIEIYALEEQEYGELIKAGVDGLTIYQETYNETLYNKLHIKGPKKNYRFRLDAPERACMATMRAVNIGALLGLDEWRREAFLTGLHAHYLQDRYPDVEVSVSLPRLCPHAGDYHSHYPVSDMNLVQIMLALRLFMPRAGITISTREAAVFRDNIIRLGVTKMSAGSSTKVGGHTIVKADTGQFDISDERTVAEMKTYIEKLGYQPVFKDWQPIL